MPAALEKLETAFGLESSVKLTPAELIEAARGGDGTLIPGLHGARLVSTMVNSSRRFEVRDFQPQDREWLKARGAFSEVIQYKTRLRSEEHTSELQSLMRISYAVFCVKKKKYDINER